MMVMMGKRFNLPFMKKNKGVRKRNMKIGDKIVVVKELNDLQTKYKGLKGTIEIIREETSKSNISIKLENGLSLWVCKDEIEVMENKNERELKIRLKKNKRNHL